MKNFLSKSYKELFGFSFGFVTLFALLEIIGLYHPNNANIYDLYRCLRLSLLFIIGVGFILVCVILSFCHLRKQKSNGNITEIYRNNILKSSYTYDELGQLTRENNADSGKTTVYNYDGSGNITGKRVYNYKTSQSLSGLSYTAVNYSYGFNTGYWSGLWGDLLKSYNGQQISYDEVGNPVEIGSDISLSWTQGRLLSSYEKTDGEEVYYKYNADGIRTSKTVAGKEHRYTLNGTQVLSEEWTVGTVQHLMIYVYDAEGSPVGFRYRNSTYYSGIFDNYIYGKNVQGDIIYIFTRSGDKVAEFTYDAWGNPVSTNYYNSGSNPGVTYSPFRYRGYWYDEETGLYYLNSRYYNPEWGRFLNADIYLNANGDILGFNMFAYCGNNPVNRNDPSGEGLMEWDEFKNAIEQKAEQIKDEINKKIVIPVKNAVSNIKEDIRNFDILNTSEDVALKSHYVSWYKNRLIIRTDLSRSGSFGIVFLSRNIGTGDYAKNTLNHEYGHTIQLKLLGVTKYTAFIGIPSVLSGGLEELEYYSMPWERSADIFGGVKRPTGYLPYSDAFSYLYLANIILSPYPDYFYGGGIHLP